jgi:hypothetical protein
MTYVFIGGIPASGKSYLARDIASETGAYYFGIDSLRREMSKVPHLKYWTDYYRNLDEEEFYKNTPCEGQWEALCRQSEAFWPTILENINKTKSKYPSAIFEGVNLLPHLTSKYLDFPGIFLLGESFEQIFARNKERPRWGKTEEVQRLEAENFFHCEGMMYKQEAEKYGYKTFHNSNEAKVEILKLLKE